MTLYNEFIYFHNEREREALMSENTSTFDALERAIESNDELKDALIELQRKAVVQGWTREEHAERVQELLQQNGLELAPEDLLTFVKDAGSDLTDDELEQVAGESWGKSCNKRKECPGGTGRSCYPHC